MSLEQAATMLVLMLVAQIPLLITAVINFLKSRENARIAVAAAKTLGDKLDDNHAATKAVEGKAATIVKQTNGTLDAMKNLMQSLADRVTKLEEYNHASTHRLADSINAMHLKVAEMVAQNNNNPKPADKDAT